MDTWLIAHCMAKLPPLTYFSHPEASLDEFFSGEDRTRMGFHHRDDHSSSIWQGPAPHELQFLRSLGQSLGTHPTMGSTSVPEFSPYHHCGRPLPRSHSSDFSRHHPSITADERTMSQPLDDYRSLANTGEVYTSLAGPATVFVSPSLSPPTMMQVPATSSTAPHVVSCAVKDESKLVQPRITTDGSSYSRPRYQCSWEIDEQKPCGEWIEGGSKEVWIHVRTSHGLKGQYSGWCHCRWGGCLEKLKVSSLRRHLAKHLEIRWRCTGCETVFSRYDYARRHIKRNKECHGSSCYPIGPRDNGREPSTRSPMV